MIVVGRVAGRCSGSEWSDRPDRAKVARVNCGGAVRVVRDDVLLGHGSRWLVREPFLV